MAEEQGSMYSKSLVVGDLTRTCLEEDGRYVVLWHQDGLVQSYATDSSEEWARRKAEEAGLRWTDELVEKETSG